MSERSAASAAAASSTTMVASSAAHSGVGAMCTSLAKVHLDTHTLVVASTRRAHEGRRAREGRVLAYQHAKASPGARSRVGLGKARRPGGEATRRERQLPAD